MADVISLLSTSFIVLPKNVAGNMKPSLDLLDDKEFKIAQFSGTIAFCA